MKAYHRADLGSLPNELGLIVVYDFGSPKERERAREQWRAWGDEFADILRLSDDQVLVVFRPGGAAKAGLPR